MEIACDGQQAVDLFKHSPEQYYDLILMDVQMPILNGYAATKKIRSLERADVKTLPIVAMTANAFVEDIQNTYAAGMNTHLSKPIDIQKLKEILDKYLA